MLGFAGFFVSIPNRDLDELQQAKLKKAGFSVTVSIPNRDLDELQPLGSGSLTIFSFQGAVARIDHQYTIPAIDLKRGSKIKTLKPL